MAWTVMTVRSMSDGMTQTTRVYSRFALCDHDMMNTPAAG